MPMMPHSTKIFNDIQRAGGETSSGVDPAVPGGRVRGLPQLVEEQENRSAGLS